MKVMMFGVDESRKGGMWTVVSHYLRHSNFCAKTYLRYIPTVCDGSLFRRIVFFARAYCTAAKELRAKKYTIVHMHLSEKGSLYRKALLQRLAKKTGCKTIIHMHGADFETWYQSCDLRRQGYIRKTLSAADSVLILGRYWERFVGRLLDDPGKIQVLYNAVEVPDSNRYNPTAGNLMFLGAMIRRKGILDLLQAFHYVRDRVPPACKLILCGDDPEGITGPEISRLGLQDRVVLKGWVGIDEIKEIMAKSAVNILPSYHEGLPMTILEAMAFGLPNISTRVAAIPEAITDGENGILIDAGNVDALAGAIVELLGDAERRASLSESAWKRAKADFSIEAHMAALLNVYDGLNGQKG